MSQFCRLKWYDSEESVWWQVSSYDCSNSKSTVKSREGSTHRCILSRTCQLPFVVQPLFPLVLRPVSIFGLGDLSPKAYLLPFLPLLLLPSLSFSFSFRLLLFSSRILFPGVPSSYRKSSWLGSAVSGIDFRTFWAWKIAFRIRSVLLHNGVIWG